MTIRNLYKIVLPVCVAGLLSTGMAGCRKYNDWNVDDSHNRLFRPSEFAAAVDGVTLTLQWVAKPNTNKYTLELSKDSLQFGQIVKTYQLTPPKIGDAYIVTLPDLLDPLSRYSARIRGRDTVNNTPDSEWATVTFLTTTEQILLPIDVFADLSATTAKLKWTASKVVSHFMIGNTRYDISNAEKAAGEKTITGLTPGTEYTAYLHLNTSIRGSKKFSTDGVAPGGSTVLNPGDDLAAAITAATNGSVLVLPKGSKYNMDNTVTIPAGISLTILGIGQGTRPIIASNGFTLPATAGTVKFENVDMTGYQNGDPAGSKRSYIFNQSTATNTAEIIFENCVIRNLVNTPLRLQSSNAITIGKVSVNKCIVYDIGDNNANGTYAFINTNTATGKFNNISITNSTFYKIGYGLILHNAAPSQSLVIDNNTFYNITGDGRYFIDYNAQVITGTVSFQNNIIGKTLSPLGTARGIRAGTAISATNSYKASDVAFSANPIAGITDYSKASTDLFTDVASGNFLIKDNGFSGRSSAGDPRWRIQ